VLSDVCIGPLSDEHRRALREESWLTDELIDAAKIGEVDDANGRRLVGVRGKLGEFQGVTFPNIFPGEAYERSCRLRRDEPDVTWNANGERKLEKKYLTAPGTPQQLYFPPVPPEWLLDPALPVAISEGEKKSLALHRLATHECPQPRWLAIAVTGVWNWMGRVGTTINSKGRRVPQKGVIYDFSRIAWDGRLTYIVYDSDVQTNESIKKAQLALTRELLRRGARVRWVEVTDAASGNLSPKLGADDVLATRGPEYVLSLFEQAVDPLAGELNPVHAVQYVMHDGCTWKKGTDKHGLSTELKIAHFTAEIVADVHEDDGGIEQYRRFDIEGQAGGSKRSFTLPLDEYLRGAWPQKYLGCAAVIEAHQTPHLLAAIPQLSHPRRAVRYRDIGWRFLNGKWVYLDADGAIGSEGRVKGIEMALSAWTANYRLRLARNAEEREAAVKASLGLLDVASVRVGHTLLATAARAPLPRAADFVTWLAGDSGRKKSELSALAQQHFGAHMDRNHLPAHWRTDTANALGEKLFLVKHGVLVVDDFPVAVSGRQAEEMCAKLSRVIAAVGEGAGRGRMSRQLELQSERPPYAMLLSNGEDLPRQFSQRARIWVVEVEENEVELDLLTVMQAHGASGLLSVAMAEYIRWLALDLPGRMQAFEERVKKIQGELAIKGHARMPHIVAELEASEEFYLSFGVESDVIHADAKTQILKECRKALFAAAKGNRVDSASHGPAARFVALLRSALLSGRAHLVRDYDGVMPALDQPGSLGWRHEESRSGGDSWRPGGERIGYVDGSDIYLDLKLALPVVRRLGRESGDDFEISEIVLRKRLHEAHLLMTTDINTARETYTVRHTVLGHQLPLLHFSIKTLTGEND
jgi:hypothetical protein